MIIGILGCGNMGSAIAIGFTQSQKHTVVVYDRNQGNRDRMVKANINVLESMEKLADACNVLILAVEPENALSAVKLMEPCRKYSSIVSVVAGVTIAELREVTGAEVARAMPNVACSQRRSTTLITPGAELFECIGDVFPTNEKDFDTGSVLCSCQTAFAMRYIRAAQLAGIKMGMRADDALKISAHCVREAMEAVLEGEDPDSLMNAVMTPGGWTVNGICELEAKGFTNAVVSGLGACK